jgi:hypothetical protein
LITRVRCFNHDHFDAAVPGCVACLVTLQEHIHYLEDTLEDIGRTCSSVAVDIAYTLKEDQNG